MLGKVTASAAKENAGQSGVLRRWVEEDLWDFTIGPDIHDKQCTGSLLCTGSGVWIWWVVNEKCAWCTFGQTEEGVSDVHMRIVSHRLKQVH